MVTLWILNLKHFTFLNFLSVLDQGVERELDSLDFDDDAIIPLVSNLYG